MLPGNNLQENRFMGGNLIIRMSFEGMRQTLIHALSEHQAKMDEDLKRAVDAYCAPENIERVVTETAQLELDRIVRDEVKSFFSYGKGREAVREAIKAALLPGGGDVETG